MASTLTRTFHAWEEKLPPVTSVKDTGVPAQLHPQFVHREPHSNM